MFLKLGVFHFSPLCSERTKFCRLWVGHLFPGFMGCWAITAAYAVFMMQDKTATWKNLAQPKTNFPRPLDALPASSDTSVSPLEPVTPLDAAVRRMRRGSALRLPFPSRPWEIPEKSLPEGDTRGGCHPSLALTQPHTERWSSARLARRERVTTKGEKFLLPDESLPGAQAQSPETVSSTRRMHWRKISTGNCPASSSLENEGRTLQDVGFGKPGRLNLSQTHPTSPGLLKLKRAVLSTQSMQKMKLRMRFKSKQWNNSVTVLKFI